MKIAGILFVAFVGYRLGRSDLRCRPALVAVTVLVATTVHLLVRLALPHEKIERIATAAAWSLWSPALIIIAAVETSGIWLPVLLIPWAASQARFAASAYIIGAATLGALVFYRPFDVVIINDEVLGPTHPEYELSLVLSLAFAVVPFAIGLVVKRRLRAVAATDALRITGDTR